MEELLQQVSSVVRSMWSYRWTGLIAAWVVAVLGSVVLFRIPDRYEASARIYVDTQSILKPLMQGLAVQPNVDQQVGMLSRTLISRPNIEKLVRMADLDLKSESKAQQEALIENLQKSVEIKTTGRDNLYSLSYVESDRDKAKRVIQSMVSIFVESSLGASRKDTDSAKVFLDEQIKSYETKLEEAETRLKDFRLRNIDMQTGDGKDSASRLSEINQLLARSRLELREAEQARDAARRQIDAEKSGGTGNSVTQGLMAESATSVATPEVDARLDALRRNLDALLQRYTDAHPDIVTTRRMVKELEEQKRKEVAELRKAAMASPTPILATSSQSAATQELSRLLANSEVMVAALRARVTEYTTRYAAAKAASRTSPQIEAEAAQLNRDYGIIKKSYEDLVSRRQSAVMSGDLDMASGVADFRLIDPPRVSQKPVSPNRLLLLPLVLVASLGVGFFSAFAAAQLRPVYNDGSSLGARTGLPVLGTVSMIVSEEDRRSEQMGRFRFLAGSGGLVGLFMIAMITVSILSARQLG